MRVFFKYHARKQIESRHIKMRDVIRTLKNPDLTIQAKDDTMKAKKYAGKYFLNVIFKRENSKLIVITVFSSRR